MFGSLPFGLFPFGSSGKLLPAVTFVAFVPKRRRLWRKAFWRVHKVVMSGVIAPSRSSLKQQKPRANFRKKPWWPHKKVLFAPNAAPAVQSVLYKPPHRWAKSKRFFPHIKRAIVLAAYAGTGLWGGGPIGGFPFGSGGAYIPATAPSASYVSIKRPPTKWRKAKSWAGFHIRKLLGYPPPLVNVQKPNGLWGAGPFGATPFGSAGFFFPAFEFGPLMPTPGAGPTTIRLAAPSLILVRATPPLLVNIGVQPMLMAMRNFTPPLVGLPDAYLTPMPGAGPTPPPTPPPPPPEPTMQIAVFQANRGGVDQTGIINGTNNYTQVLMPTTVYNDGNYYNISTSKYTPPAGVVIFGWQVWMSAGIDPNFADNPIYVAKLTSTNGDIQAAVGTIGGQSGYTSGIGGTVCTRCNGAESFWLIVSASCPTNNGVVNGNPYHTWWSAACFIGA